MSAGTLFKSCPEYCLARAATFLLEWLSGIAFPARVVQGSPILAPHAGQSTFFDFSIFWVLRRIGRRRREWLGTRGGLSVGDFYFSGFPRRPIFAKTSMTLVHFAKAILENVDLSVNVNISVCTLLISHSDPLCEDYSLESPLV